MMTAKRRFVGVAGRKPCHAIPSNSIPYEFFNFVGNRIGNFLFDLTCVKLGAKIYKAEI